MNKLITIIVAYLVVLPLYAMSSSELIVLFNEKSQASRECAQLYASLRSVPAQNLVGLDCSLKQDITRKEFDEQLRLPLLQIAVHKGWHYPAHTQQKTGKNILGILLMPDMPLRIKQAQSKHDVASVDSELALLGSAYQLAGPKVNPFYKKDAHLSKARPPVLSVCRIDAPTHATAKRMMTDALAVEKAGGLWGWLVVDSGGPYDVGDKMFAEIIEMASNAGQAVFHESSKKTIASQFPLPEATVAYYGWYSGKTSGPFKQGDAAKFRFSRGAVACHLHSYSATSVKAPTVWVGGLLEAGAAVTVGNVYEPMLSGAMNLSVFHHRLLRGYCVAEAALMATPTLSWQGVVLGDPLYKPFKAFTQGKSAPQARQDFATWRNFTRGKSNNNKELIKLVKPSASSALQEMLAWRLCYTKDWAEADAAFTRALSLTRLAPEQVRLTICLAIVKAARGRKPEGKRLLLKLQEQPYTQSYLESIKASLLAF